MGACLMPSTDSGAWMPATSRMVGTISPFLRRMVRRVRGSGNLVAEEWLARINLIDAVQVINGVVGHAGNQVPAGFALEGIDLRRVAEQVRLPLVCVAADEPVEIIEALPDRPILKRSD